MHIARFTPQKKQDQCRLSNLAAQCNGKCRARISNYFPILWSECLHGTYRVVALLVI
jgi:hypothetical protein